MSQVEPDFRKRSSLCTCIVYKPLVSCLWGCGRVCKSSNIKHPGGSGGFVLYTKGRPRTRHPLLRFLYFCQITPLLYCSLQSFLLHLILFLYWLPIDFRCRVFRNANHLSWKSLNWWNWANQTFTMFALSAFKMPTSNLFDLPKCTGTCVHASICSVHELLMAHVYINISAMIACCV